jgi:hypothetical protein
VEKSHFDLSLEPGTAFLTARASGRRTLDAVTAMALQVAEAAEAAQAARILIDVRELEGRLGVLENYLLVRQVFERLRGMGLRRAAVVDREPHPVRGWVLETMARNSGFNLRLFSSYEDASRWLQET